MLSRYILVTLTLFSTGCEVFFSDVATRVRYAIRDNMLKMQAIGQEERTVTVSPNHWPDSCGKAPGYELRFSPPTSDTTSVGLIDVFCRPGTHYWSGTGGAFVLTPMTVTKTADEEVRITLRRVDKDVRIIKVE